MSYVVTSNVIAGRDNRAPAPALHENGDAYAWRMFFDNDQRIVDADSADELLGFLIPNYRSMEKIEQKAARFELARAVQSTARATILAGLTDERISTLTDWEIDVINFGNENQEDPYGWGDGSGKFGVQNDEMSDEWSSDIPLVLLDVNYAPYTEILPPLSSFGDYVEVPNIIWLRPTAEIEFLTSLSGIGYIRFGTPSPTMNGEVSE